MTRPGSAFQRAASGRIPESSPQTEEEPVSRSASYKPADQAHVPPLAIAMLVCGTRGDVQPFLALALGLQKDGHRVRLATHAIFKDYVESYGIEFFPMGKPLHMCKLSHTSSEAHIPVCPDEFSDRICLISSCSHRWRPAAAVSLHGRMQANYL